MKKSRKDRIMSKNIEMNYRTESGYEVLYPNVIGTNIINSVVDTIYSPSFTLGENEEVSFVLPKEIKNYKVIMFTGIYANGCNGGALYLNTSENNLKYVGYIIGGNNGATFITVLIINNNSVTVTGVGSTSTTAVSASRNMTDLENIYGNKITIRSSTFAGVCNYLTITAF